MHGTMSFFFLKSKITTTITIKNNLEGIRSEPSVAPRSVVGH